MKDRVFCVISCDLQKWQFYFFSNLNLFIFLLWLLWLGLPKLWQMKMASVGILVFFLEEKLSAFHHWVWCLLWIFHTWLLLCWHRFRLCPLSGEFLLSIFFCIYWEDHMVFTLQCVDVVYHTDWFVDIAKIYKQWKIRKRNWENTTIYNYINENRIPRNKLT